MSGPKRGPGVSEAMHRKMLADREARIERQAEQAAEVTRLAESSGSTENAIRQAQAEAQAARRDARQQADLEAARLIVGVPRVSGRRQSARGPKPMRTEEEVIAMRARLLADEQPSGERSLAKALGISRDAVRYALGKDRRKAH